MRNRILHIQNKLTWKKKEIIKENIKENIMSQKENSLPCYELVLARKYYSLNIKTG